MINFISVQIKIYYFVIFGILSYILSKYNNLGIIASIIIPLSIFLKIIINLKKNFQKEIKKLNNFALIKGIITLIPIIVYANYKYFSKSSGISIFFTIILAINLLEVSILLGFHSKEKYSKLRGLNMLILTLYTPILFYNNETNLISFDNNMLFGICKTLILTNVYLFNNFYYGSNWRYSGICAVVFPLLYCLFNNSSKYYMSIRAYYLVLTFFTMTFFKKIHNKMIYPKNNDFSIDKYDKFNHLLLFVEYIFIYKLVKQGTNNTLIGYLGKI